MATPHDRAYSSLLDVCRWMAAWVVFLGHVRGNLFPDYKLITDASIPVRAFLFVVAAGQAAVMVFFVLSGFLVGGALYQTTLGRVTVIKYFIARFCRLYLVLIPALGLSVALAVWRYAQSGGADAVILSEPYSLKALLVNLGFLQVILGPPYANNYPLWSLTNEFWYDVTFPMLLAGFRWRRSQPLLSVLLVAAAAAILLCLSTAIALYSSIWLLGVIASTLKFPRRLAWITLPLFAIAVAVSRLRYAGGYFPADLFVGLTFAATLSAFRDEGFAPRWLLATQRANARLAGFSFTLYVLHAPVLAAMIALTLAPNARPNLDVHHLRSWLVFAGVSAAILAIAYGVSRLTEARTYALRSRVTRWLLPGSVR